MDNFLTEYKRSSRIIAFLLGFTVGLDVCYPDLLVPRIDASSLQGVGLALLTVLLPLAIAIVNRSMSDRSKSDSLSVLKMNVVLDEVFRFKALLVYFLLLFIPTLLWDLLGKASYTLFLLLLTPYLIGCIRIGKISIDLYRWLKNDLQPYYIAYLNKIASGTDFRSCWHSVWSASELSPAEEEDFFQVFYRKILKILELPPSENVLDDTIRTLSSFQQFIPERSQYFIEYGPNFLSDILSLHHLAWVRQKPSTVYTAGVLVRYSRIREILSTIIFESSQRILLSDNYHSLFLAFPPHTEASDAPKYKSYLVRKLLKLFFEFYPQMKDLDAFWLSFPESWKCTLENLKSEPLSRNVLDEFQSFCLDSLRKCQDEEQDNSIDDIFQYLFPEFDPPTFAVIWMIFVSRYSYDPSNRMRSLVEQQWPFGLQVTQRSDGFLLGSIAVERIEFEEKAAVKFGRDYITKFCGVDFIKKSILELKELESSYTKHSRQDLKVRKLLSVFCKMDVLIE